MKLAVFEKSYSTFPIPNSDSTLSTLYISSYRQMVNWTLQSPCSNLWQPSMPLDDISFRFLIFGLFCYCWKLFPVLDSQIHSNLWSHCTLRKRYPQRRHGLQAKTCFQSKYFHSGYHGGHFSQLLRARLYMRFTSQISHMLEEVVIESHRFEKSSVLCLNMKQQLEWWLGTWRRFQWVSNGKPFVLMGCWWWWVGCCNPGGQVSQLSQVPQPCQLDASRPWEPLGPQGQEPERQGTNFLV